ncbi:hypothetical protein HAX54_021793 [Datura stramonium]|uniref:Uncharacterized protein n=1 Tax=Datura stramonium TaxID=4076 RepID=A0ABS8UW89_DATST|nr:hypothetical protein [Datura stramonium]
MMSYLLWLCPRGYYLVLVWTLLTISSAMPPPNPVKCNDDVNSSDCVLSNSYGIWGDRQTCRAPKVVYPTTEEQLRQELANANKNNLKVKVVTRFSHTIPN